MKHCDLSGLPKATLVILLLVAGVFSQDPKCEFAKLRLSELRGMLLERFKVNDYDQAYKIATEMVGVGETNCADNDDILLMLNMNVAQIQIKRRKLKEAQQTYVNNLELAEKVYGDDSEDFEKYTADLLKLSTNRVSDEEFESYVLRFLDAKRKRFENKGVEIVKQLVRVARFYATWKKPDTAERFFLEALDIADKLPIEFASEKENAINRYRSFQIRKFGYVEGLKKDTELMQSRYKDVPFQEKTLNGLAYSLPRPAFPFEAKRVGASGQVVVEISVDQNGTVASAKAISGHPLLRAAAKSAAKNAKFLPTYLKGQPVKVQGIITYNFRN